MSPTSAFRVPSRHDARPDEALHRLSGLHLSASPTTAGDLSPPTELPLMSAADPRSDPDSADSELADPLTAGPPPTWASPQHSRPSRLARFRSWLAAGPAERLPPTVRGGRVWVDPRTAVALAALGLMAVALAATFLVRARPAAEPVPAVASLAVAMTPAPVGPSNSPAAAPIAGADTSGSPAAALVVHVVGKVARPGVVTLPTGSRVIDAMRAAGGARPGVDTSALNLARLVVDGEQVAVGVRGAPPPPGGMAVGPAGPGAGPTGPTSSAGAVGGVGGLGAVVDLNAATAEQLQELPGVGPVLAQRIVEFRQQRGGFRSVDELRDVTGIGERRFADLRDRVRV